MPVKAKRRGYRDATEFEATATFVYDDLEHLLGQVPVVVDGKVRGGVLSLTATAFVDGNMVKLDWVSKVAFELAVMSPMFGLLRTAASRWNHNDMCAGTREQLDALLAESYRRLRADNVPNPFSKPVMDVSDARDVLRKKDLLVVPHPYKEKRSVIYGSVGWLRHELPRGVVRLVAKALYDCGDQWTDFTDYGD